MEEYLVRSLCVRHEQIEREPYVTDVISVTLRGQQGFCFHGITLKVLMTMMSKLLLRPLYIDLSANYVDPIKLSTTFLAP